MKRILRIIVIELAALYMATQFASGLIFARGFEGLLITSIALGLAMHLLKPIINLLLLPINLATMGLFRIVAHAITIFIVDVALTQFEVSGFNFPGMTSEYFDLPSIVFEKGPLAYLAFAIVISSITGLINWLRK